MSAVTRKRARQDAAADQEVSKRKRSDTAEPDDNTSTVTADIQTTRDVEFWLDDGTAIITARDVEFRVYKGVLATHSPFFKDLLAQSHATRTVSLDAAQQISCPVVKVDDSPEDLRHILRAYMPRTDARIFDAKDPSFDIISASIRLGRKYGIAPLVEQSLAFLKSHYTDSYDTWTSQTSYVPEGWNLLESIGVLNLARLTGESSILPTALLVCTQMGPAVVRGFRREDGTLETLPLDDLALYFEAKTEIRKATLKAMLHTLAPVVAATCKAPATCQNVLREAVLGLCAYVDNLIDDDPFGNSFEQYVKGGKLAVCGACLVAVQEREDSELRKMWSRLPEIMGVTVPGWGQPAAQGG
ncbi:hypothetical protein K466DRAFT_601034 [Polyporus arcularius HHB13444]|uniref:BTB domain-containing protein n=1 Tax=Polyporus arcularius HHB13444 TaxID=1314778 RepID=A0A5C3P9N1_9APHY|nr:hypothetical protein K466DRAFT_601034 [Polyporus arcularius HHB13444]